MNTPSKLLRAYIHHESVSRMIDLSDSRYDEEYLVNGRGKLVWIEGTLGGCNLHEAVPLDHDWLSFRAEVTESTRQKDKDGVTIFRNDIVRDGSGDPMVVVYDADRCQYVACPVDAYVTGGTTVGQALSTRLLVIGDVYRNPEMLTP